METADKVSFKEQVISGIEKAFTELEAFNVQAALGKAEAQDAFESAKKSLKLFIHESWQRIDSAKETASDISEKLKTTFENLQVQLALGKAETKESFEEQRKFISLRLNELETFIKRNKTTDQYYTKLRIELEKFKIKLDILQLRYDLKKLESQTTIKDKKSELEEKLQELKQKLKSKSSKTSDSWETFKDEINEGFTHLRKAFKS